MTNNDNAIINGDIKQPAVIGVTASRIRYQGKPTSLLDTTIIPQKSNKRNKKSKKVGGKICCPLEYTSKVQRL